MRHKLLFISTLLLSFSFSHAQQLLADQVNVASASSAEQKKAIIYLPEGFSKEKKYPLVVYLHGAAQAGTDIEKLYLTGLPKVLKAGYKPAFDFIMIAAQGATYSVNPQWLEGILQDAEKRWNIDTNRVYLTGIDAGGWAAYGSQLNVRAAAAKKIAAIVTISAATQNSHKNNMTWWQQSKTPLLAIAGQQDIGYARQNTQLVNAINKKTPGLATLMLLPGTGHGGWDNVYNGKVTVEGKTIWEWLQQWDRSKPGFSKPHITQAINMATIPANTVTATTSTSSLHLEAEKYVKMYGVRTQTASDAGGGQNVGWIDKGDWMDYTVTVATSGTYAVKLRLASGETGAQLQIKKSSGTVLTTVNVAKTGSFQTWKDVYATIPLVAGTQTIRFQNSVTPHWNINWFELKLASTGGGIPFYAGTKIEAEKFIDRSGVLVQTTRDFASGYQNLFDVNLGDWVSYKINAPVAGQYTLNFRMACDVSGSKFQIKNSSGTVLTTVTVPNTNGWQTWRDVTAVVSLGSGAQTLKLQAVTSGGWNLNYFECVKTPMNAFAAYTIRPNSGTDIYLPKGLNLAHLKPGDTLYILGGAYNVIDMGNFRGSATNKIIIRNKGGQVSCKVFRLSNTPEYFKLLGNGKSGVTYGFKINGGYATGSCLSAFGTGFEIAYVEALQSKSGFFIKKNPVSGDLQSQYPNYEMANIKIHHNYLHQITGEAMYIGHTAPDGGQGGNPLLPVRMRNVEISYNIIDHSGWDGIQLSNATTGNKIHHNTVTNFGTANQYGQQAGILLGANSQADIYNNTVKYGTGNAIQNFGFGLNKIYNNYIEKAGRNGTTKGVEAVYCNDIITKSQTRPKQQIQAYSNTIKYPLSWGAVRVSGYNKNSLPATMQYNKVLLPNAPSDWQKLYFPTYVPNSIISGNTLIN